MYRTLNFVVVMAAITACMFASGPPLADLESQLTTWKGHEYAASDSTVYVLYKGLSCRECYQKIARHCAEEMPHYDIVFVCARNTSVLGRKQTWEGIRKLVKQDSMTVLFAQSEDTTILSREYESFKILFPEVIVKEGNSYTVFDYKALHKTDFSVWNLLHP